MYKSIESVADTHILQKDLDLLASWESSWQMSFNAAKCYVLRISAPNTTNQIITSYKLGDDTLQETSQHTYLGVDIQKHLKWNTHISRVTTTASKTLGFVRRNLASCTKATKIIAYKSLIRQTLKTAQQYGIRIQMNSHKK